MYRFIVDRTSELEGKLQVIIVDHADLNNASFREYICENWWPIDKILYQTIGTKRLKTEIPIHQR